MEEFNINLVGNDEEIKKEEIFNDFDFNYVPINNLPVSYFPLNNGLLSNELKKINNEVLTEGEILTNVSANKLTITSTNSPYTILVKKNIDCNLNLNGTSRKIRLNKGIYTIIFNFNGYNIIQKNNIDIYKELKGEQTDISLDFINESNLSNVKKISSLRKKNININESTGFSIEPTTDNPSFKLLVYRNDLQENTLILNKDITCDILIVGGGGSGGRGGGGGGGAVIYLQNQLLSSGTYSIIVGWGGTKNIGALYWNKGADSIILFNRRQLPIYRALGGGFGYGGNENGSGGDGGSGGGTKSNSNGGNALSTNIPDGKYGKNGGMGKSVDERSFAGGGGGGSSSVGQNAILEKSLLIAGKGGDGTQISITGTPTYYGGGGGGGCVSTDHSIGSGGLGGGGAGSKGTDIAISGTANTGGGGGGSEFDGKYGSGGSGIVIFRVKKEDRV